MRLNACRRLVAAPKLDKSVLPKLDAVLLSHNHYDHLDVSTITALHREYGDTVVWYVAWRSRSWSSRPCCSLLAASELPDMLPRSQQVLCLQLLYDFSPASQV